MSDAVRSVVPDHFPCALRFGRASAPMIPQHVHTICGRKARTSTGPRYPVTFLAFKRRLAYWGGRGGVTRGLSLYLPQYKYGKNTQPAEPLATAT